MPGSRSPADPPGDGVDTMCLFSRWRTTGDRAAREQLIARFLPLARKLAGRYRNPNEPFDDLVQVAYVGLVAAVDRFDPDRGFGFPAFAIPTILGELRRHFRNTGWSAHVSRSRQERALQVTAAAHELEARTGRSPTLPELAEYLEIDLFAVVDGLEAANAHYAASLSAPASATEDEATATIEDGLGHTDDGYGLVETRLSLESAVRRLPRREQQALMLRMHGDLTQSEVAARLGCSQMQVSRLLRQAARTVRELMAG